MERRASIWKGCFQRNPNHATPSCSPQPPLGLFASQPALAADLYTGFTLVDPETSTATADAWLVAQVKIEQARPGQGAQGRFRSGTIWQGLYGDARA